MIVGFTASAGWKRYYKKSKISIYSVLSGQGVIHMGFSGFMPNASLGLEYNLSRRTQVKIGGIGLMLLNGNSSEFGAFPFVGLNFLFWLSFEYLGPFYILIRSSWGWPRYWVVLAKMIPWKYKKLMPHQLEKNLIIYKKFLFAHLLSFISFEVLPPFGW